MAKIIKIDNRLRSWLRRLLRWGQRRLPWGMRSILGVVLLVCGLFGFLPVLGFWMIPIGLALISLDFPPLRRRLRRWWEGHA